MHSKPGNVNASDLDEQSIPQSTTCSQPWWRGSVHNTETSTELGESSSKPSLIEQPDSRMETNAKEIGDGGQNEGGGGTKEMQTTIAPQSGSDGQYGQEHQNLQLAASTMPPAGGEYHIPRPQFELVGHSIACATYPYSDPYYAGMMGAMGSQSQQVQPHLLGVRHSRMPLPLEISEEPVYVNAKQYHGILRRRQSRAKAELEKKLIKSRKPYLHESRHQHAMRRARGCGGRFLNTKKPEDSSSMHTTEEGMTSDCNGNRNSSNGRQIVNDSTGQDRQESNSYSNNNTKSCYRHNQGLQLSSFHSLSGERVEEEDCSGQQRGNIQVKQAQSRALTIQ
ncbi:nuclear transcription factor Y subunit A-1-like isoform X1 [Papaver somniferum]|uniref:nuclear transcription factor Y subunit A-1-like isoform X1 n=1 Tax=Papaver somniferum TaxID=3469 RepID=UPI000E6F672B|nr:nuclear transcription factor Y subunit A-1-like isoform X1 [Papaver somniferum]